MIGFLKNKKKLYIAMFIFIVLSISIGYAYLSSKLSIKGTTEIGANMWDISFENIVLRECNVFTEYPVSIDSDTNNKTMNFSVEFKKADDRYDFLVDIANNGSISAMIDSFSITGDENIDETLNYSVTYLDGNTVPNKCDALYANDKITLLVSISLSEDEAYRFKEAVTYHLSLNFNFVQLDDKSCEIKEVPVVEEFDIDAFSGETACKSPNFINHYNLYIDPNGGTYDGSEDVVVVKLLENQTYDLKAPIKENNRNHWNIELGESGKYYPRYNTVEMGTNDIYATATWSDISNYVARINENYYETIQAAFDDAEAGDVVVLLKDTTENPTNNKAGAFYFDMHGYSVSGTLTNARGANLTLINEYGSLDGEEGTKPSYYQNLDGVGVINYGTLTLGINNDDEPPLVDEGNIVAILGSELNGGIGLKNNGIFNFYDGYLEGYIGLSGVFNKAPNGYYVYVDHNTTRNCQKVYLIPNDGRAIAKSTFPSGGMMLYWDLQDALKQSMDFYDLVESTGSGIDWASEIGDAKTVEIIRDGWEASYPLQVYANKTAKIDAAGFSMPTGNTITNDGDLYLVNSVPTKGGMDNSKPIINNGTLHLDGIIINQTTDANTVENNGDLDIKKSTVRAIGGYAIKVNSGTELIMDSVTYLAANKHALHNATSTNFTVQGGIIESIKNDGKLTIKEGTLVKKLTSGDTTYGILNSSSSSELTLDNLTLEVIGNEKYTYAIYNENNNAKVIIKDGDLEVTSRRSGGSVESSEGATLIYGGIISTQGDPILKAINPNGTSRIVYGANSITVNGGTWEASGSNTAVFAGTGVTINGGTIKSTGTNSKYIVYNYDTSGKNVTIGGTAIVNTAGTCFVMRDGTVNINNGEITCGGDFVYGSTWANAYSSNHRNFGTINVNGATITAGGYGAIGTGTVNMGGGTIRSNSTGLYLTGDMTSSLNMTSGTIISSNGDGIYSGNSNNHFTFGNNEFEPDVRPYIEGASNGIYMSQGGVTFKSGESIGNNGYGLYLNKNSVFGINDRHVSTSIPMIKGTTYGLYIGSTDISVEVYDGIFKGETHGYYGVITAVADGYQIKEDGEEVVSDELTLNTCYLVEQDSFLQIERTGSKYNSLQDAIDAAEDGDTIIVLKDHPVRSVSSVPSDKNLTLNFNNYTLSLTQILTINGSLTLMDTDGGNNGGIEALITRPIVNRGTLNISSGLYNSTNAMVIDNYGTTNMNGGSIVVNTSATSAYAVYNESDSVFVMNDGLIDVNGRGTYIYGIYNNYVYNHPVRVTINGGTIDVDSTYSDRTDLGSTYGANTIYGGTVTFNDGELIANNTNGTARVAVESTFTMNGGEITSTGKFSIGSYNSNFTMNHGVLNSTATSKAYAEYDVSERTTTINNDSVVTSSYACMEPSYYSTINVNGGSITCGDDFVYGIGSYNMFKAVNVTGGTIKAGGYGIYGRGTVNIINGSLTSIKESIYMVNEGSTVKIYGGDITSESKACVLTDDAKDKIYIGVSDDSHESTTPNLTGYTTGVYAPKGTVNINLANVVGETEYGVYSGGITNFGIDEEISDVSTEKPMIKGEVNGVYINKGATVNIYDGIFKGIDAATVGFISGFPDAYTFVIDSEEIDGKTYETKYLTSQGYFLRVHDKENGEEFNSLQQAIDSIEEEDTIYVIADYVIKTEAEIPEGKNITLDFNGHTLLSSKSITNNGTLTFEDETGSGGISTSDLNPLNKFVINNNKFVINGGNYMGLGNIVFYNTKDMEVNGGYISNNSSLEETYGIKMVGANTTIPTLKITGGTIDINSSGTYAYGIYTSTFQSNVYPYPYYNPEITIEGGIINVNSSSNYNGSWNYRNEIGANAIRGGKVTIEDAEINAINPNQFAKLFINSDVTINGGTYLVESPYAIAFDETTLVQTGGSVTATGTSEGLISYNYNGHNIHVSGDTTWDASHKCIALAGATTTIDNGTFTCGEYGFAGNFGTFDFNNGIVNVNNNYAFSGYGTLNIRDGEVSSKNNAINITSGSTINITGGEINSTEGYGLYSTYNDNIRIGSDTNYPTTKLPYIYGSRNGVQISSGTLNLGTKDQKIDLVSFILQGGEYGLNNTGEASVNFYDGILKGTEDGYNGLILTVEEGTDIIDPTDTEVIGEGEDAVTYQLRYLVQTIDIVQNRQTGVKYNSLQNAITEAENGQILDLIANAQIYYPVTIPQGKEVTLDHQGYEIVTTKTIVNRGNFTVQDSSSDKGNIDTSLRIYIYENHGTLNISDITINNLLTGDVRPLYNDTSAIMNLDSVTVNSVNNVTNKGVFNSIDSIFNSTNTAITDYGIINITGGEINATSRGIYSDTNGNGELNEVTITSQSNPIYKYGGSSVLTVTDSDMMIGQIYNRSGTLKFVRGHIYNKIVNSATLIADGTIIADESHLQEPYYSSYTSIENSGTLELDNVTYTLETSNNGNATMLNNSGTFKSNNSTYDFNKTNDYKWCPNYYYQPSCGGNYGHLIYNTGNIITSGSDYNFRLTDPKTNHETYMYLIEHRGGKITTDGDTFNMEGGLISYGIYSTTSSDQNYLKDTTIDIDSKVYDDHTYTKAKTKYGIYQTQGEYLTEGTQINVKDATNAWGVYIDKGTFTMQSGGGIDVGARTAHGIYIATAEATATVGLKDGDGTENANVKTDYPEIKAIGVVTGIGVRKINGTFNFYDGVLIGNTHAKPEITTDTEPYYEATSYYDEDNDYVYCRLEYIRGEFNKERKTATINNVFYDTLQKAFDKAKAGETIRLARADVEESPINNNVNDIILDLHNYTLAGTITNNGYLTINGGQVNGGENYSVINNNVLKIGSNDEEIIYDEVMLISDGTSVQNNGTVFMYGGYIKGITALVGTPVKEPYYGEVVKENVEETVGEETTVYETIYLKEYTGLKVEKVETSFDYTGDEQTFIAPETGYYLLETWGASGGLSVCNGTVGCGLPGYGGYSRGVVYLNAGDTLYINVGGRGGDASLTACSAGGYNGGGKGVNDAANCTSPHDDESSGGGGGATHIATKSGLLYTLENDKDKVLIVAGGGGGSSWKEVEAGSGGGFIGGVNTDNAGDIATQTEGYAFGKGKDGSGPGQGSSSCNTNDNSIGCDGYAGGGGGWYGGGHGTVNCKSQGNGGSGYIGNSLLESNMNYDKVMYGYKVQSSSDVNTKTISTELVSNDPESNKAKNGDGAAKVTLIREYAAVQLGNPVDYEYVGHEETFIAPEDGYYLLETWGAQGGSEQYTSSSEVVSGGYGGYSRGVVFLSKGQVLNINVGGKGEDALVVTPGQAGGYNGGGSGGSPGTSSANYSGGGAPGGGGATHIATVSGLLSTLEEQKNNVLIVAGGGGGGTIFGTPGSGGGYRGADSGSKYGNGGYNGGHSVGGDQSNGYGFGQGQDGRSATQQCAVDGCEGSAGAGGGWYGGTTYVAYGKYTNDSGSGGSGYIGNSDLLSVFGFDKVMYGYNVTESDDSDTRTVSVDQYSDDAVSFVPKGGNGHARLTKLIIEKERDPQTAFEYNYKGEEEQFIVPKTGYYLLETWGAQGGATQGYEAGYGAYSRGAIYLTKGEILYINVGGQGAQYDGGYNGGGAGGHGNGQWGYGGGGATHIALTSGLLSSLSNNVEKLLIVSGGGGGNGGHEPDAFGGSAGGINGNNGFDIAAASSGVSYVGTGGLDSTGGYSFNVGKVFGKGSFGLGSDYYNSNYGGAGGGGGYYGGGGSNRGHAGGGGGSGYIANSKLISYGDYEKAMYSYKGISSGDSLTKTYSVYDYSVIPVSEKAKAGSGYAKITFISSGVISVGTSYDFDYINEEDMFVVPTTGYYKLETWGAQGGNASVKNGGYGGYSVGSIYLNAGQLLYINVGGQGISDCTDSCSGGYNGGGSAISNAYRGTGGGATHIALVSGTLDTLNYSQFVDEGYGLIVAGGGGGSGYYSNSYSGFGGAGGGYIGVDGVNYYGTANSAGLAGLGATQTAGGEGNPAGTFGHGADAAQSYNGYSWGGAGGGGGLYGGGAAFNAAGAGGGSGYIANPSMFNKKMVVYASDDKYVSDDENTKTELTGDVSEEANASFAKKGNGYAKITFVGYEDEKIDAVDVEYDYTGDVQEFTAPSDAYYLLEAWGAQGGGSAGGTGGYSRGYYYMNQGDKLYVYVGGKGNTVVGRNQELPGGWNGGGGAYIDSSAYRDNYVSGSGGGATDFTTVRSDVSYTNYRYVRTDASYNNRILVAGGGSGSWEYPDHLTQGAVGGGLVGGAGYSGTNVQPQTSAGSQSEGGSYSFSTVNTAGSFGLGGNDGTVSSDKCGASGGGAGWYGGAGGNTCNADPGYTGGGGSGYVGGTVSYNGINPLSIAGDQSMPSIDGTSIMIGNTGNGYARITAVIAVDANMTFDFSYSGNEQTFVAPKTGYYQLETWGAQGGSVNNYQGGYGSYSTGEILLTKGTMLYINVGGEGQGGNPKVDYLGGYNGGGTVVYSTDSASNRETSSGGGATHIATSSGLLSTFEDKQSDLLIVSGGGGGAYKHNSSGYGGVGGSGGGSRGANGTGGSYGGCYGLGATQSAGGNNSCNNNNAGSFGQGGSVKTSAHGSAGGGGYYGGGASNASTMSSGNSSGAGGSGYIGNLSLSNKKMVMYSTDSNFVSNDTNTKTEITTDVSDNPIADYAKSGNGYARITYIRDDVTNGLRSRVLNLYSSQIENSVNHFIVYRNDYSSADLVLYDENYDFQLRLKSNEGARPHYEVYLVNDSKHYDSYNGITMTSNGSSNSGSSRYFYNIQLYSDVYNVELFDYPNNIDNFQVYKKAFNSIITEPIVATLDQLLVLPSSYNGESCDNYLALTYNDNAQFYCMTGDARFIYDPNNTSNKNFLYQKNGGHFYRFKFDSDWNIVFDMETDYNSLNNYKYDSHDMLDLVDLTTFDITDSAGNVYFKANTTVEKMTTNYVEP